MAGLKEWFKQDWVDIGSKKKGGGFNKCGQGGGVCKKGMGRAYGRNS